LDLELVARLGGSGFWVQIIQKHDTLLSNYSQTLGAFFAGNVGAEHAVFEQGASAGNVGNEKVAAQKTANPVALLLSSAMMLRHLQFPAFADRLEVAVEKVILEGKYRTKDLGGTSTTQEVVDAVIDALD
jgi:isocitrate dehydrogenase (NAD+)